MDYSSAHALYVSVLVEWLPSALSAGVVVGIMLGVSIGMLRRVFLPDDSGD